MAHKNTKKDAEQLGSKHWASYGDFLSEMDSLEKATAEQWLKARAFGVPPSAILKAAQPELKKWITGECIAQGRIRSLNTPTDLDEKLAAILTEVKTSTAKSDAHLLELTKSLEFAHQVIEDLQSKTSQMEQTVIGLQKALSAQQATIVSGEGGNTAAVVISGIEEAGEESEEDVKKQIQDIFVDEMHVPEEVQILSVTRLGSQSRDAPSPARPRKLLVEIRNAKQAMAVLRSARNLKAFNQAAAAAGKRPIGIDRNLNEAERKYRSSLWETYKKARGEGKRTWWRGHHLFIDDVEVFPTNT